MPAIRCPHCNRTIKVPANLAGQQRKCPACYEPFTVPTRTVQPEADPVGAFDFIPDRLAEQEEQPQRRRPLTRTSALPWALASVFGLLTVTLGIVVGVLITHQPVADKLAGGVKEKEVSLQPATTPRPAATPVKQPPPKSKPPNPAVPAKNADQAWREMANAELFAARKIAHDRPKEPFRPELMTEQEYKVALLLAREFIERPTSVDRIPTTTSGISIRASLRAIMPCAFAALKLKWELETVAKLDVKMIELMASTPIGSDYRPLVSAAYRSKLQAWSRLSKRFSSLNPDVFDSFTLDELKQVDRLADQVEQSGLKALSFTERHLLLRLEIFDWYERQFNAAK